MHETIHFSTMLQERSIAREWVDQVISAPDKFEEKEDGTCHFLKRISARENRWLRVIVNTRDKPNRLVTAFFDRRLRRNTDES